MIDKCIVYISCTTYNHAPFITDALNGFCMQETNFPFVCGIIDDASTDGEQEIILDYIERNFDLKNKLVTIKEETKDYIRIYSQHIVNKNCYFVVNLLKYNHYRIKKSKMPYLAHWREKAKYISTCEGDDYWTEPLMLQKQVDFLEQHPETGVVHAKAKIYNQETHCFRGICGEKNGSFEETLVKNPIVTLTACCRESLFKEYQAQKSKWDTSGWKMGDYPMWIWMSYYSSVHFMDEVVAVYREVEGSATHPKKLEDNLDFLESTYQIQLFFANLFQQGVDVHELIKYNADRKKAISCLEYGNSQKAKVYQPLVGTN